MVKKNDINYFMNLPYKVIFTQIPFIEGGGYIAEIEKLNLSVRGENQEDSIKKLKESAYKYFSDCLDKGVLILEP